MSIHAYQDLFGPAHLLCYTCDSRFPYEQCINWLDDCKGCEHATPHLGDSKMDRHRCPNCFELNAYWSSGSDMVTEKIERREQMRNIPSFQCGDCGLRFTQQECASHKNSNTTCMEHCLFFTNPMNDAVHHCPTCKTHNAHWVGYSKLLEGETSRDYIHTYFQLLADRGLLCVTRRLDKEAFHLLTITQHDGTVKTIHTHLHAYELHDHGIVEQLFCAESFKKGCVTIRIIVDSAQFQRVDVFEGLQLDEREYIFELEVPSENLTDIIV